MGRPAILLIMMMFATFVLPILLPSDPMRTNPDEQMQPPGAEHPLGADLLGRDILSRTLYGGQRTILTAVLGTVTAVIPGVALGLTIGRKGGRADRLAVAVMNAFVAVPGLLLALVVITLLGRGIPSVVAAVGISQIIPCALVTRTAVIGARSTPYVEAAQALGASHWRIATRHIFPNILPTLVAYAGVAFAYCILNGAALSFLELGGEPGAPEWGAMLADARPLWRTAPWVGFAPGLAITITVMSVNRLIDTLPHSRR